MKEEQKKWFQEYYTEKTRFDIGYKERLCRVKSEYQTIEVYDTVDFGRILVIDGYLMLTQKDEFIYHEMMVHVPMALGRGVKHVLVIGGGDGGVLRELVKYPEIETIYLAELDEAVTRVCRTWFPEVSSGYEDSRVILCYGDGVKFVEGKQDQYDLILVDSTDPVGPGEGLFSRDFYQNCYRALKKDGILVNQHESPYYPGDRKGMLRAHQYLKEIFPFASVYQFHMPSYASGLWLFGLASKGKADPEEVNEERWGKRNIKTGYYNPKIHRASFALPEFVWDMLGGKEPEGWRLL